MTRFGQAAWVTAAVAAFGLAGTPARAAAAAEVKIGVVDVQRVTSDSPRMRQYAEEIDAFKKLQSTKLFVWAQNEMLEESEIKELVELKTKANPTAAEKARIKALTDTERSRDDELKKLQETSTLGDKQKARLRELQSIQRRTRESAEAATKGYYDELSRKSEDLYARAESEIQAAVKTIAEARKLTLVLAKRMILPEGETVSAVLFGGMDITDDVIARLDRKAR